MMDKIIAFLIYAWCAVMAVVIIVSIGKIVWNTDYAWIGVILALVVLGLTRNINIITIGTKKVPKTGK